MSDIHPKRFIVEMDGKPNGTKIRLQGDEGMPVEVSHLINKVTIEHGAGELPVLIMQVLDPELVLLSEIDGAQSVVVYPVDPSTVEPGDIALMDETKFE